MQPSVRAKIAYRFTSEEVAQAVLDLSAVAKLFENDYMAWVQGRNFNYPTDPPGCCAFGGLMHVTGERDYQLSAWGSRVTIASCVFSEMRGVSIVGFNDAEDRTKEQVIKALRDVAKELKEF
jgi:hypothetical protein